MLLHTDADNRAFIAREFPKYLGLYDGYDTHIKRVDAVRYFLLYRYGGVYMDLDMTCLRLRPLFGATYCNSSIALRPSRRY